jgi:hypothetical protein
MIKNLKKLAHFENNFVDEMIILEYILTVVYFYVLLCIFSIKSPK